MSTVEQYLHDRLPDSSNAVQQADAFLQDCGYSPPEASLPSAETISCAEDAARFLGKTRHYDTTVSFLVSAKLESMMFLFEIPYSSAVRLPQNDPPHLLKFLENVYNHPKLTMLLNHLQSEEAQADERLRGMAWKLESYRQGLLSVCSDFSELSASRQTASEAVQRFRHPFMQHLLPLIDDLTDELNRQPKRILPMVVLLNSYLTTIGIFTGYSPRMKTFLTEEQRENYRISPVFVSRHELSGLICGISRLPYRIQYYDADTVKTSIFPGAVSVLYYN